MSTFTTPGPAALTVRFAAGRLVVNTAGDGESAATTTVEVRPANPDSTTDVEHAAATDGRTAGRHDRGDRTVGEGLVRPQSAARHPCRRAVALACRRRRQVGRRRAAR